MAYLIVRDTDGKDILTRDLTPSEEFAYFSLYADRETVSFDGKRYTLHSVARTRPERNVILLVSFDSYDYVDC